MRCQLFDIACFIIAIMFFSTPANAGWGDKMKDAIKSVETARSILNKETAKTEQLAAREQETSIEPQMVEDEEDVFVKPSQSNKIESKPMNAPDAVIAKNQDEEEVTAPSVIEASNDTPKAEKKIKSAIIDIDKLGLENVSEQQVKEAESVYEWCIGDIEVSRQVDCQCLASNFLELRIERGPDATQNLLFAYISQRTCRNIEGTSRMEYAKCIKGTGFRASEKKFCPKINCRKANKYAINRSP